MMYRQSPIGISPEVVAINVAANRHKAMDVAVSAGCLGLGLSFLGLCLSFLGLCLSFLGLCLSFMQRPIHPPFGWVKPCCGWVEILVDL